VSGGCAPRATRRELRASILIPLGALTLKGYRAFLLSFCDTLFPIEPARFVLRPAHETDQRVTADPLVRVQAARNL
jgi:hypothetical protein